LTDAVEKVENRTRQKISQILIFELIRRSVLSPKDLCNSTPPSTDFAQRQHHFRKVPKADLTAMDGFGRDNWH
jgi:hypothetical protein